VVKQIFKFLRNSWPILVFSGIYILVFYKTFFRPFSPLIPFPGDLLVSGSFPYPSGGWEGFTGWVSHKEFILADVIRQMFPWRTLAMDLIKHGELPLWNIYSFSGTPLMANLQSAVWYPFNILFFILPSLPGWVLYILIQPLLAGMFMYAYIRSLHLSRVAALVAAIGFAYGVSWVWFEMGVVGHSALWLPLILWGITKFVDARKTIFLAVVSCALACSILAGHAQTALYVLIFTFAYFICTGYKKLNWQSFFSGIVAFVLGVTLSALQLLPSLELMIHAARGAINSYAAYHNFQIPWSHLTMFLAPDILGNPATGNFIGKDYGELNGYTGIVVLLCAAIGFFTYIKRRNMRLLLVSLIVSMLVALPTFFSELLFYSGIPVLSTSIPSRALFVVSVCLVIASAYGVEALRQRKKLIAIVLPAVILIFAYVLLWGSLFVFNIDPTHVTTMKRNLLLPSVTIFSVIAGIFIVRKLPQFTVVLWVVIFSLMGMEYAYTLNKYLPYASVKYAFPDHPLINQLSRMTKQSNERTYGHGGASIMTNIGVQWRVMTPEGYDPLYVRRYGELMQAGKSGRLDGYVPRSDALLPESVPTKDTYPKQVLLNILGVKYILAKDDDAPVVWSPYPLQYPPSRFKLIYQEYKWKIYENRDSLPRAAVFYDYEVQTEKSALISRLFNPRFHYKTKLLLEENPSLPSSDQVPTPARIVKYAAGEVVIAAEAARPGVLFLSDTHYPGWEVAVDGKSAKIIRANYTFRAVSIPKGKHIIVFQYRPYTFFAGVAISALSLLILVTWVIISKHEKTAYRNSIER
jgi:hypothetical protein